MDLSGGRRGAVSAILLREDHTKRQKEHAYSAFAQVDQRLRGLTTTNGLRFVQLFTRSDHVLCAKSVRRKPRSRLFDKHLNLANCLIRKRNRLQRLETDFEKRAM